MPPESTHGDIHTGDVSGTFVVGDDNRVTNTTRPPEQPQPQPQPQSQPQPGQQNSAADQAAVFAVEHGTMHVTYNAAAERGAEG
ncbi:hypothetical protein AB5J52_32560 [Streptomyces sp. R39]|uniref:Uncharacterized protein n=1 Tax=Streptomyces sp. R39 TaxID=3238631 RepID=A0AB39QVD2_9ACTN